MDKYEFERLGKAYCKKFGLKFLFANASNLTIGFENDKGQQGHVDLEEMVRRLIKCDSPNDCDVELSDIVWDTEQEDGSRPSSKMLGLPNNVKVHSKKDLRIDKEKAQPEEISNAVGNYLCDRYGYRTISWKYKSLD